MIVLLMIGTVNLSNLSVDPMHRSTAGHNPYNLFILTIVYSKNLPTSYLRTIEHMTMFVVKSIHIQINSQVLDLSIVCVLVWVTSGQLTFPHPLQPKGVYNTPVGHHWA